MVNDALSHIAPPVEATVRGKNKSKDTNAPNNKTINAWRFCVNLKQPRQPNAHRAPLSMVVSLINIAYAFAVNKMKLKASLVRANLRPRRGKKSQPIAIELV